MVAHQGRAAASMFLFSPKAIRRGIEILLVVFTAVMLLLGTRRWGKL
jgi:hypothetical protein